MDMYKRNVVIVFAWLWGFIVWHTREGAVVVYKPVTLGTSARAAAAAQQQDQMQRRLLRHIVVCERAAVLQLLAAEHQPLLVCRDAFTVLDRCLHRIDRVAWCDVERDGLSS